jgi:2-amino-4-hydroxy-6-hydroxymethyldihydropteridine diphosphokinase
VTRAVLSLGSNLDDRVANLRLGVAQLGPTLRAVSTVYETPPWGDPDQPDYLNAVVVVAGPDEPYGWLDRARAIEAAAGRTRDPARRYGPRVLDVDVIAVWTDEGEPITLDTPELTLPHPRAHLRAFVLRPWADVAPDDRLPGHGAIVDLLAAPEIQTDLAGLRSRPEINLAAGGA